MNISFGGYYKAMFDKGKTFPPLKPHYICPMGDKIIIKSLTNLLQSNAKDKVTISKNDNFLTKI